MNTLEGNNFHSPLVQSPFETADSQCRCVAFQRRVFPIRRLQLSHWPQHGFQRLTNARKGLKPLLFITSTFSSIFPLCLKDLQNCLCSMINIFVQCTSFNSLHPVRSTQSSRASWLLMITNHSYTLHWVGKRLQRRMTICWLKWYCSFVIILFWRFQL